MKRLAGVNKALHRNRLGEIGVEERKNAVRLTGKVDSREQYLKAGYIAAGRGYRGVINDIEVNAGGEGEMNLPSFQDNALEGKHFNVAVVGGGVIGAAIARELTRWNLDIVLLEKEEDLARHASSRNNGVIHPAFAPSPGTNKAYYNCFGNRLFNREAAELGIKIEWPGSMGLFTRRWMRLLMPFIRHRARQNGVRGVEYISPEKLKNLEPHVNRRFWGAVFFPETGNVSPYKLTIAYGENAAANGARVFLQTGVEGFTREQGRITGVQTNRGTFGADVVINAAGLWADRVAEMAGDRYYTIHARRGTIAVLDKKAGPLVNYNLGVLPLADTNTKGGGVTLSVDGNVLAGPTAEEVPRREDYSTSRLDIDFLFQQQMTLNELLRPDHAITYFAGNRACTFEEDFIVEPSPHVENLIHVAGMQSPGLTAVPAVSREVSRKAVDILSSYRNVDPDPGFSPYRKPPIELSRLSLEERSRVIKENPSYGRIVCRCEVVSEGEIIHSLQSPLGVFTLDGIKRRVRAGMGRCQGGFCTPRLVDILAREAGADVRQVRKSGPGSELVLKKTKGEVDYTGFKLKGVPGKKEEENSAADRF